MCSPRTGAPHVALSIDGLTGHILGTLGHKPRQSERITANVILHLVVGSAWRPGSVQQFNPDRGLRWGVPACVVMRCGFLWPRPMYAVDGQIGPSRDNGVMASLRKAALGQIPGLVDGKFCLAIGVGMQEGDRARNRLMSLPPCGRVY
jgi:hypothetical protein